MDNLEIILTVAGAVIGFIVTIVTFIAKSVIDYKARKSAAQKVEELCTLTKQIQKENNDEQKAKTVQRDQSRLWKD